MRKLTLFLLLFVGLSMAQTKYFMPVPIENSAGTPIRKATVIAYPTGTTTGGISYTWLNGSRYYTTTEITAGFYDIYTNSIKLYENIWMGERFNITGTGDIIVPDTVALKALTIDTVGQTVSLLALGAAGTGGGIFVHKTSGYTADGVDVIAHGVSGYWVRTPELKNLTQDTQNALTKYFPDTVGLKNETGANIKQAYVEALGAAGTGGGVFVYKTSGTPDKVNVITRSAGGYWHRLGADGRPIPVTDAGAVNDSTANISGYMNTLIRDNQESVYLPAGVYRMDTRITDTITKSTIIRGDGKQVTKLYYGGPGTLFSITKGVLTLEDLTIYVLHTNGVAIQGSGDGVILRNVEIIDTIATTMSLVRFGSGNNYIYDSYLELSGATETTNTTLKHDGSVAPCTTKVYNSQIIGEHYTVGLLTGNGYPGVMHIYNSYIEQQDATGDAINLYGGHKIELHNSEVNSQFYAIITNSTAGPYCVSKNYNTTFNVNNGALYKVEGTRRAIDSLWFDAGCVVNVDSQLVDQIVVDKGYINIQNTTFNVKYPNYTSSTRENRGLIYVDPGYDSSHVIFKNVTINNSNLGEFQGANTPMLFENVNVYIDSVQEEMYSFYLGQTGETVFRNCKFINHSLKVKKQNIYRINSGVDSSITFENCTFLSELGGHMFVVYNKGIRFNKCDFINTKGGFLNYQGGSIDFTLYINQSSFQLNNSGSTFIAQAGGDTNNYTFTILNSATNNKTIDPTYHTVNGGQVLWNTNTFSDSLKINWRD